MRRSTPSFPLPLLLLSAPLVAAGCASERVQYAYAYPTAPPVYTQPAGYATPAVNSAAGPAVMPAPVATLPPGAVVAGTLPTGTPTGPVVGQPDSLTSLPPGAVLISDTAVHAGAISEGPCPPMTTHGMAADGTIIPIAGESQTAPCPQEFVSEVVVPGSFVR